MLRIQRSANGKVVFLLSGRIEPEDIAELQRLFALESSVAEITLNLRDLVLADSCAMEFLAGCEERGMSLDDCPAYVRNWINQPNERSK